MYQQAISFGHPFHPSVKSISLSPANKNFDKKRRRKPSGGRDDIRSDPCRVSGLLTHPHLVPSLSASSLAILSSSPSTTAPPLRPFFLPFLTSSPSSPLLFLPAPPIPASPAMRCASLSKRSRFRASRSSSCGSLSLAAGAGAGAGAVGADLEEDFWRFSFSRSRSCVREREGSWREERES
jgi:hypothetical protein